MATFAEVVAAAVAVVFLMTSTMSFPCGRKSVVRRLIMVQKGLLMVLPR